MSSEIKAVSRATELPLYYTPPQKEGLINRTLPLEIFLRIFSFLFPIDHQSTVRVCKDWHRVTIKIAGDYWAGSLLAFLKHNLDEKKYSFQKERFEKEFIIFREEGFKNIPEIRKWQKERRSLWIDSLKTIDFSDLSKAPLSKANICNIALIYKEIDSANENPNISEKVKILYSIFRKVHSSKESSVEMIIKTVSSIPSSHVKFFALHEVIVKLISQKNFESALSVAKCLRADYLLPPSFSSNVPRLPALLSQIAIGLLEEGKIEQALETAERVLDANQKYSLLKKVAQKLNEQGEFEKALSVVKEIPREYHISNLLVAISEGLTMGGRLEKALEAVNHIPKTSCRFSPLMGIAKSWVKKEEFEQALEAIKRTVNKLRSEKMKREGKLRVKLAHWPAEKIADLDVVNIANFIPEERHSEVSILLYDIAKGLEAQRNLKKAAEAAVRIPNEVQQKHAVESIVQKAIGEGGFKKSLELANSMLSKEEKDIILYATAAEAEEEHGRKRRKLNSGAVERH